VYGDKNMIETVIRNLVSNGIKFTKDKGKVSIAAKDQTSKVQISVEDTGVGMTQETMEKLFEIRDDKVKLGTNREKGTGLGLILCKQFIELHQSKLKVNSTLNEGSKFYFDLPKSEL
jgi:signal transduction histidine kinase